MWFIIYITRNVVEKTQGFINQRKEAIGFYYENNQSEHKNANTVVVTCSLRNSYTCQNRISALANKANKHQSTFYSLFLRVVRRHLRVMLEYYWNSLKHFCTKTILPKKWLSKNTIHARISNITHYFQR